MESEIGELIIKEEAIQLEDDAKDLLLYNECDISKTIRLEKNAENIDCILQNKSVSTEIPNTSIEDFNESISSDNECDIIKRDDTDFMPHSDLSSSSSDTDEDSELIYSCQYCDFQTKYRGNLNQHKNTKHLGKIELCQFCGNKYKDRSNLNRHIRVVHKANYKKSLLRTYNCIYCTFSSIRKGNLDTHMNSLHTLENIFPCKICSYVGTRIDSYRRHMQGMHGSKKKLYKCSRCNFKTAGRDLFEENFEENHKENRLFPCKFCEYKATFSCNLSRHIQRKHSN